MVCIHFDIEHIQVVLLSFFTTLVVAQVCILCCAGEVVEKSVHCINMLWAYCLLKGVLEAGSWGPLYFFCLYVMHDDGN